MGEEKSNVIDKTCVVSFNSVKRACKLICSQIGQMRNPWLTQAASDPSGGNASLTLYRRWNTTQILLLREFYGILFMDEDIDDRLLQKALDFVEGDTKALVDHNAIRMFDDESEPQGH